MPGHRRPELVEHLGHQRRVEGVRDGQRVDPHARARAARRRASSSASAAPETTHWSGALTAASARPGRLGEQRARPRSPRRATAAIPPAVRTDCISRARAATSVTASGSANSPATAAAATSPMLWPDQHARPDAPRHPQLGQRVLEGEQGRLGVVGLVDQARRPSCGAEHQVPYGRGQMGCEQPVALVHPVARRPGTAGTARRPCPGTAMPCPLNRKPTLRTAGRGGPLVAERGVEQSGQVGGAVSTTPGEPVAEVGPADVGGVAQAGDVQVGRACRGSAGSSRPAAAAPAGSCRTG